MKIVKLLNNNAYIATQEDGSEVIVMGRGVGFQKKAGMEEAVPEGARIFSNQDDELNQKMKEVISQIPIEYMGITEKVVALIQKKYNKKLQDIIYVSLTEHIQSAVERHEKGIKIKNPLITEIRRLYQEEYEVALETLDLIRKEIGIEFEDDEAGYIAFHIVNAELDGSMNNVAEMTQLVQTMVNLVRYQMQIDFREDSIEYDRFITHLKFFAQRVLSNKTYDDDDEELFDYFKNKYEKNYKCVCKINALLEKDYHYEISESEQTYLMIHIQKLAGKHSR